jgi:hypothetical protein
MAERPDLASAMYPNLSWEAKRLEQQAKAISDWREREKQSLLRHLRAANAAADARLRREGKR